MEKQNEAAFFYTEIEKKYNDLLEQIIEKDCQRVEFLRGMISVYKEILISKSHWENKEVSQNSYFK